MLSKNKVLPSLSYIIPIINGKIYLTQKAKQPNSGMYTGVGGYIEENSIFEKFCKDIYSDKKYPDNFVNNGNFQVIHLEPLGRRYNVAIQSTIDFYLLEIRTTYNPKLNLEENSKLIELNKIKNICSTVCPHTRNILFNLKFTLKIISKLYYFLNPEEKLSKEFQHFINNGILKQFPKKHKLEIFETHQEDVNNNLIMAIKLLLNEPNKLIINMYDFWYNLGYSDYIMRLNEAQIKELNSEIFNFLKEEDIINLKFLKNKNIVNYKESKAM